MKRTIAQAVARAPLRLIDCAKQRRVAARRETVLVLQALLTRAVRGEVDGLALVFRSADDIEHMVFTGPYGANSAEAVNAAARMTWRLSEKQEIS